MLLENYAKRVRFVRSLTKLSREAFESKHGINRNTLKSWELGINTLTEKSAIQLASAIQKEGFSCSPEWLIFGMGSEPTCSNNADISILNSLSEQTKIIHEAEYFKKNNINSVVSMISDNSMLPLYQIGDYVGGIIENVSSNVNNLKKFVGNICIICLDNEILVVRKMALGKNNHILLCPINNEFETEIITIHEIQAIADIVWQRNMINRDKNYD